VQSFLKAAWSLLQLSDAAAVPSLLEAIGAERDAEVQHTMVRAAVQSGGRGEAAIRALALSPNPKTRAVAVRAMADGDAFDPWPWPWPRPRPFP
jgi:HEAT repeat protein